MRRFAKVRQPAPAGPWMAASCAWSAPTSAGANPPSALSTALNSGLISRPTSRTCCRSPGSTPGLLWAANHTCLCAGSLLQEAGSKCGGVGGKRRWWEVATATGCSAPFEADQGRALGGEHGGGGQRRRGRRGRGGAAARAPPPSGSRRRYMLLQHLASMVLYLM